MPFYPFVGEGSPTKIDYGKKVGTLILTSNKAEHVGGHYFDCFWGLSQSENVVVSLQPTTERGRL